ncbi:phage holin, LLH family [Lactobacillus sp. ESL0679]|uniref:phage holin, LLH family n=1 Tax=Lactobacillus sp. ESL0679 TaxID=2983209 RepID=UPI0023F97FD5|nr:phage holin, LLH family [Lactobacillus sp. ESL0679]MDF7683843.1 phage holin, LLH family [Lactobacillus sp. ESL0679]
MNNLTDILQLLSTLSVIIAFLFVGLYPYIQEHNKPLASKLDLWYQIAQVLVNNEATKTKKAGAEKKQAATDTLVKQAQQLNVPLEQNVAAGLIQTAYDQQNSENTNPSLPDTMGFVPDDSQIKSGRD